MQRILGRLPGLNDWTDVAIADPSYDLALIHRDLGPEVFDLALAHYGGCFDDADRRRSVFYARCSLIEGVASGLSTPGARRYAESGLAHLARIFAFDARMTARAMHPATRPVLYPHAEFWSPSLSAPG